MKRRATRRSVRSRPGLFAVVAVALAAAVGCERVDYYSLTGSGGASAGGGATTSTTTTTTSSPTTTSGSGTSSSTAAVTRAAVLEAVGICAASLYGEVAVAAASLRDAAATAAKTPNETTKLAARAAWNVAIDRWQQAEVIRVGPAGPASTPGGKELRHLVYSWPLVSRCLVEQTVVAKSYEKPDFSAAALVNTRGLAAAEYLLFFDGADNACSAAASINATGAWAALSGAELEARKLAYAKVVAADVAVQTRAIADGWAKGGGDFQSTLANAGKSGSLFGTDQLAMNAVSDGLFYIDDEVKDLKLGRPLGLIDCEAASCPETVESRHAKRSRDHVKNNLIGLRRVLEGCDEGGKTGFDDLLAGLGAGPLAERLRVDLEAAIVAADALPSADIAESLAADPAVVKVLHAAVKKVTDVMKTELVTVLDLELPQNIEGDND